MFLKPEMPAFLPPGLKLAVVPDAAATGAALDAAEATALGGPATALDPTGCRASFWLFFPAPLLEAGEPDGAPKELVALVGALG